MRTASLLVSMAFVAGCTPGLGPVFITQVVPQRGDCNPPMMMQMPGMAAGATPITFIDVAADRPSVAMAVTLGGLEVIKAPTSNPPIVVGTRTLATGGRENVRIEAVQAVSSMLDANGRAPPFLRNPVTDTITVNQFVDEDRNVVVAPLFGMNIRKIFAGMDSSNEDEYQMTVRFDVRGVLVPSNQPIRTEPFPVSFKLLKSRVDCGTSDTRLARVVSGTPLGSTECSYYGVDQKFNTAQCCSTLGDPNVSGCEPIPMP